MLIYFLSFGNPDDHKLRVPVGVILFEGNVWGNSKTMGSCTEFSCHLTLEEAGSSSFSCYE